MARTKQEGTVTRDLTIVKDPTLIKIVKGFNHRVQFNNMKSLENDILARGVLDPVKVRRDRANKEQPYILIDGERRYRAVLSLHKQGHTTIHIPVTIINCDEQGALEIGAVSNLQRSDITATEEASIVARLEEYGHSAADIAEKLGMTTQWVSQRRTISGASTDLKKAIDAKQLPVDVALEIARNVDLDKQSKHVEKIVAQASDKGTDTDVRKESKKALGRPVRPNSKQVKVVETTLKDLIADNKKTQWKESVSPLRAMEMMYSAISYAQGLTPQEDVIDIITNSIEGLSAPAEMIVRKAS